MSQVAYCFAVRDKLQTTFSLDADSCQVQFDGAPTPMAGELYIAVHPLNWDGQSQDWDLTERIGVGVTITLRMGFAPKDRWGIQVWADKDGGLEALARRAIKAIHQDQLVRQAANTSITNRAGIGEGGFVTALRFMNAQGPTPRDHTWFSAPAPQTDAQVVESGASIQLNFGQADRVQGLLDGNAITEEID